MLLANAQAAVDAGVTYLDASIGGIGGCPFAPAATGNVPTDDLLYMLDRSGVETGVSLEKVIEVSRWLVADIGDLHGANMQLTDDSTINAIPGKEE